MSKLDYIQGSVRLGVFYQQQSRRRRYCFSWRMPGRIWTVVSLLTQVAESIFNGLGIFWFSKGKKWYNCCISACLLKNPKFHRFEKRIQRGWFFCLQLQTLCSCHINSKTDFFNLLSRSNPGVAQAVQNICCLTLPCDQPVIHTDTFVHNLPQNTAIPPKNPETQNIGFFVITYSCLRLRKGP